MTFSTDTLLLRLKLLHWFTLTLNNCDFVNIRWPIASSFGPHVAISTLARIVGNIFSGYLTIAKVALFASSPCRSRVLSILLLVLLSFTSGTGNSSSTWSSCRWLIRIPGISHELLVRVAWTTWVVTILVILDMHRVFFTLRALVVIALSLVNFIFFAFSLSLSRVSCRIILLVPLAIITLTVVRTRNATLVRLIFGTLRRWDCFGAIRLVLLFRITLVQIVHFVRRMFLCAGFTIIRVRWLMLLIFDHLVVPLAVSASEYFLVVIILFVLTAPFTYLVSLRLAHRLRELVVYIRIIGGSVRTIILLELSGNCRLIVVCVGVVSFLAAGFYVWVTSCCARSSLTICLILLLSGLLSWNTQLLLIVIVKMHLLFLVDSVVGHCKYYILYVFVLATAFRIDTIHGSSVASSHDVPLFAEVANPFVTSKRLFLLFLRFLFYMFSFVEFLNLWLTTFAIGIRLLIGDQLLLINFGH